MDTKKKKVLKTLEKYQGIVTNACGSIHLARSTYYEWLKTDPDFKSAVDEIQEVAIDFVEGKLMEKIRGIQCTAVDSKGNTTVYSQPPSDTAIIFYLKTKGKKRGYVERSEITGKDGGAILTKQQDLTDLTEEELLGLAATLQKLST